VDHLVEREVLLVLLVRAVAVARDEPVGGRDHLDVLARHRPQLDGDVERGVEDGVKVRIARQFKEQDASHRQPEAVVHRVRLAQHLKDGVLEGHLLEVARERLAHHEPRRLVRGVAAQVRLACARHAAGVEELAARTRAHVQAQRHGRDRLRVDGRGGVDPGRVHAHGGAVVERRLLGAP